MRREVHSTSVIEITPMSPVRGPALPARWASNMRRGGRMPPSTVDRPVEVQLQTAEEAAPAQASVTSFTMLVERNGAAPWTFWVLGAV